MSNLWGNFRRALLPAALGGAAMALAACNGGGVTGDVDDGGGGGGPSVTATPYILFASNYVAYATQTNGAFLRSVQNGDVYTGFGGKYAFGCFSSPQSDMDRTQTYTIQAQANGTGTAPCTVILPGSPPTSAADFFFLAIKAPGTNTSALITPVDISQSDNILLQMGNSVTPSATGGNADVFTVNLTNDTVGDTSGETAKCSFDQTLLEVGANTGLSALGVINYVIPLSSFTCSVGTLDLLKATGVTTVAIVVTGDKNPNVLAAEFDNISVGYVGFSK